MVLFAATTWLLYRLGGHLFGNGAGLVGALLLNLTLYLSLNVGGWGWEYVLPQRALVGDDILLVVNRRWVDQEPLLTYAPWFERVEPAGSFRVWRAGRPEYRVSVYLGHGLRRPIPFRRRL